MPVDYSRYPTNWKQIRQRIMERAGWKCEWCGVAHRAIGYRDSAGTFHQLADSKEQAGMDVEVAALEGVKIIEVVLTTAHLGTPHSDGTPGDKHDKQDVRDENLAALCQRCHLRHDIDEHVENAARTRAAKKAQQAAAAGQMLLEANP